MKEEKRLFVNMVICGVVGLGMLAHFRLVDPQSSDGFWESFAVIAVLSAVTIVLSAIRYFRSQGQ